MRTGYHESAGQRRAAREARERQRAVNARERLGSVGMVARAASLEVRRESVEARSRPWHLRGKNRARPQRERWS